jgi:ABC-2 type transport system permease protein
LRPICPRAPWRVGIVHPLSGISMNKIFLILQREYLVRVKKRSFLLTTLLTPLLITAVYAIPALLFLSKDEAKQIAVLDEANILKGRLKNNESYIYTFVSSSLAEAKKNLTDEKTDALVYVPADIVERPDQLQIYAPKTVSIKMQNQLESAVQDEVRNQRLARAGIDVKVVESNRVNVDARTYSLSDEGEKTSSSGAATGIGYAVALILYMSVFLSGSQVMNGVIEEKSNRIIEVMVSSVKPMQLLLGKIIGVGLVGLTQFVLWIALTFAISTAVSGLLKNRFEDRVQKEIQAQASPAQAEQIKAELRAENPISKVTDALASLPVGTLLACFIFYYLTGYLLYSSLFAAVGSAVENPAEAQQLLFPVTIPLILSIALMGFVISEPDSRVAFWASVIPFTAPVNMMARLPFGVPTAELLLSMAMMVLGFLATTWVAARIYRVGILMYGKKPTFKELSKWVTYRG